MKDIFRLYHFCPQMLRLSIFLHFFSESFRCGVFFAGKKLKDKPFQKLFIIPKRFPINASYHNEDSDAPKRYSKNAACPINEPYGTADDPSVHNDTCYTIVSIYDLTSRIRFYYNSFISI